MEFPPVRMHKFCGLAVLVGVTISGCAGGLKHKPSFSDETTLNLGLPKQALEAPVTGNVPSSQVLHVNLMLKVSDATLNQLGRKYAKVPQGNSGVDLKKQIGISDADLKKIQDYFANAKIQTRPSKTNTAVTFDAKAGDAGTLLQTTFVNHTLRGRTFFTPDPAHMPKIPKEIAGYVLGVTGLDNYSINPKKGSPPLRALASSATPAAPAAKVGLPAKAGNCIDLNNGRFRTGQSAGPARIASAYGYDRLRQQGWNGEGMTVNLIELDGYTPSDVENYQSCVGSHVQIDLQRMGSDPKPEGESTMDMELIAGLAPKAHIVDYQIDGAQADNSWSSLVSALQALIDANSANPNTGSVVVVEVESPEGAMTQDLLQSMNEQFRILTQAEHMTVFVSSGDCGAYMDGMDGAGGQWGGTPDVSWPTSSPYVVSVGGTKMSFNGSRPSETTWADLSDLTKCNNSWGSTGGLSKWFSRPDYQKGWGTNFQYSDGHRQVPDVAGPGINVPIFENDQWVGGGGTSASSPIFAAGWSLLNQGLMQRAHGFFNGPETLYWIYNHSAGKTPFHDVTTGNNGLYHAGRGWDATTGMGTPWMPDIFNILLSAARSNG